MKIRPINLYKVSEIPPFRNNSCQPIKSDNYSYKEDKGNYAKPLIVGVLTGVVITLGAFLCRPK